MRASADIIEGPIDKLRVAVPAIRGNVHLRVNGVPVFGVIQEAPVVHTLRRVHETGRPAFVGVIQDEHGKRHFSWLITPQGPGVPPRYYRDEWRRGGRQIGIGALVTAVALASAWLLGVSSFPRTLLMTLALAVALVALLLSGLTAYGLWSALRHRRAILQSEAQYRQCAQTYSPGGHVR